MNGGTLKANSNNVTIENVLFEGNTDTRVVLANANDNFENWNFTNCKFNKASLRLTKINRLQADGSTALTGSGVTDGSKITNCEFFGYKQNYTIEIGGCDNITVQNSHIHDVGVNIDTGDGIKILAGSTNVVINRNVITNCTRDAIDTFDAGTIENPIVLSNNIIKNCGALGIDAKTDDVLLANDPQGDVIINNAITNCNGGIQSDKPNNILTNNVVTNCGHFGIRIDGVNTPLNTMGNYSNGNTHDIRIGVDLQETITQDEIDFIKNNNIYTTQNGLD